jgi:hypothetical protein
MAFPILHRLLFGNDGAGPKLRSDILPTATADTPGAVTTGDGITNNNGKLTVDFSAYAKANDLANNLGNLAKLQSFFNGTFSKTLIFGGTDKANWQGQGEITLSKSWKNFDALLAFTTGDSNTSHMYASIVWKWQLEWLIEMGVSSSKSYIAPWMHPAGYYYSFSPVSSTELLLTGQSENAGIQAIYGIKLQGTGVTNASAVDVSQIQARIAGMLTDDNHLILPSGLEIW